MWWVCIYLSFILISVCPSSVWVCEAEIVCVCVCVQINSLCHIHYHHKSFLFLLSGSKHWRSGCLSRRHRSATQRCGSCHCVSILFISLTTTAWKTTFINTVGPQARYRIKWEQLIPGCFVSTLCGGLLYVSVKVKEEMVKIQQLLLFFFRMYKSFQGGRWPLSKHWLLKLTFRAEKWFTLP